MNSTSILTEKSQLAVLASGASEHGKAVACQKLVYVAGPESIAPLAALLSHETLSDYARSGLEAIGDPGASQALLEALPELKGRQLAGAVHSLGVRREKSAVPALGKLAADPARGVQSVAIASLGMIGSPEAAEALKPIIANGSEPLKSDAGHAALVAADHLAADGQPGLARQLVQGLKTVFPKGPIHDAAIHLNDPPE
ncbi:HEAT repeat domain-containing protein [Haloferula sp.]|uniref:HEAT repeat domain-containing protein n=1 Tax=Haloferula sp. TaxID=2497595 RepID=UPI003C782103